MSLRQGTADLADRGARSGGGHRPTVEARLAQLRSEMRGAAARRDTAIAAGVLWLSGLIWLAQTTQYRWFWRAADDRLPSSSSSD